MIEMNGKFIIKTRSDFIEKLGLVQEKENIRGKMHICTHLNTFSNDYSHIYFTLHSRNMTRKVRLFYSSTDSKFFLTQQVIHTFSFLFYKLTSRTQLSYNLLSESDTYTVSNCLQNICVIMLASCSSISI